VGDIQGVLFDCEGTLVDFQWRLVEGERALREALYDLGFAPGMFAADSYATMWNRALSLPDAPVDEAGLRAGLGPVYDRWDADALDRWQLRPGARALLTELAVRGYRLAVVSNIGRRALEPALARFGLTACLETVISRDDMRLMKPSGEPLRVALDAWGLESHQAIMVGDSRTDVRAARDARVPVAVILGGETSRTDFETDPPDHFLESLEDLLPLLP